MVNHINTRKQVKQKDLKAKKRGKEKEKVQTRYLKEKLFKLDFNRSLQSNLFINQ